MTKKGPAIILNEREAKRFQKALDNPPKANRALRRLIKQIKWRRWPGIQWRHGIIDIIWGIFPATVFCVRHLTFWPEGDEWKPKGRACRECVLRWYKKIQVWNIYSESPSES